MTAAAVDGVPPPATTSSPEKGNRYLAANFVVGGAAALVFVIFAVLAYLSWDAYNRIVEQAETRASSAATILANRAEAIVSANLSLLDVVARDVAAVSPEAAASVLARAPHRGAEIELEVFNELGVQPGTLADGRASIAGTESFEALREGREWILSRGEARDGSMGLVLARAVERNGQFAGVVLLRLDRGVIERVWDALQPGPDSTMSLVRADDGEVLMRTPALEGSLRLAGLPVFEVLNEGTTGTYESPRSPVDGVARVVAYQHVPGLGLIAVSGMSVDALRESLWRAVITVLALLLPIAIAAMGGAIVTARLLRRSVRTQDRLEAALAQNELLFREIHHRVKNNLQSVGSLLQMQRSIPREVKVDMSQRIAAMAAVHEQIYRSSDFLRVDVKTYLRTLLAGLRTSYGTNAELVEHLESVEVDREVATPLGLIVNEVVSNAYKHAFPDGRAGHVTVRLSLDEAQRRGVIVVEDDGEGLDVDRPSTGIGRRLVRSLTEQIGGTARFEVDGGTRFVLDFPLAGAAPGTAEREA